MIEPDEYRIFQSYMQAAERTTTVVLKPYPN